MKIFTAFQIFGVLPCVVKKIKSSESGDLIRMEVSQLMWIWCLLLRVLYVVGQSVTISEIMYNPTHSHVAFFSTAGAFLMNYLITFNIFFAPLKWKSNILLLNHLLRLRCRIGCMRHQNNSITKSRVVFGLSLAILLVLTSKTLSVPGNSFFFKTIKTFAGIYYLILVVLQVMFFQYCCSTIENYTPDVTTFCNIKSSVTTVKEVRPLFGKLLSLLSFLLHTIYLAVDGTFSNEMLLLNVVVFIIEIIAQYNCDQLHQVILAQLMKFINLIHGGIRKELPQHSFTIVVSEASTPPTPPQAWSTRASTSHLKTRE